jgi:hypothetical protein
VSGTIITVAPADSGRLLSVARDCERVGASVLVLPPGEPGRLAELIAAIRQYTSLLIAGEDFPLTTVTDRAGVAAAHGPVQVSLGGGELPADVHGVSDVLRALPGDALPSFGVHGVDPIPVLLSALAAGSHLRVGTADSPGTGRDDARLVATASGLARLAGHPPVPARVASGLFEIGRIS